MSVQAVEILETVWRLAGFDPSALEQVRLIGDDPVLPSIFRVGAAAMASVGAVGAAAAELHRQRTARAQSVSVEARAAANVFRSERYVLVDDEPLPSPWGPVSGYFRTRDDRYVQLHANFPHHHEGLVELLECEGNRESVKAALRRWLGAELEAAASERGLCVGLLRSRDEWEAHPQGQAIAELPLFEIEKIGESPPEPFEPAERPLGGVRALDLSRIIAGPVCGRTLASHGATVLRVGAPHLPLIPKLWLELARGKRSCHLDLRDKGDRATLEHLVSTGDVFLQAYRPGALERLGFGLRALAERRPGIVYVSLSAYGHEGPWAKRRGFDSLVQTVSGIGDAGAKAAGRIGTFPLPCQALDHATGFLAAFGAIVALTRRAQEGGSWHVRVSLAQTGHWLWNLGRVDGLDAPNPKLADLRDLLDEYETEEGVVTAIGPAEILSETRAHWERPPTPLGSDAAEWH